MESGHLDICCGFPGTAGSLAAGSVSQFSIPAKERLADSFFHQKVLVIEYCSPILCLHRHFVSLKAIYFFVLNISQAHCCLLKQRPGVQLSTCHAVLIESKFVLPLLFLFVVHKKYHGREALSGFLEYSLCRHVMGELCMQET